MKLFAISKLPTCIENSHESVLRSFQLLQKVKEYLRKGVHNKVILDLIHGRITGTVYKTILLLDLALVFVVESFHKQGLNVIDKCFLPILP